MSVAGDAVDGVNGGVRLKRVSGEISGATVNGGIDVKSMDGDFCERIGGKAVGERVNPTAEDAYWRDNYKNQPYVEQGKTFNMNTYHPRYWLINGRGFPDSIADNFATPLAADANVKAAPPVDTSSTPCCGSSRAGATWRSPAAASSSVAAPSTRTIRCSQPWRSSRRP